MPEIIQNLTLFIIHLSVSLVLCTVFFLFIKSDRKHLLLTYSIFFFLSIAVLYIPKLEFFAEFKFNWQGKILSFLLTLGFVYLTSFLTKEQAGFTFKINKGVWLPMVALLAIGIGFRIYVEGISNTDKNLERVLYQLTMPGISEEPVFRGVLLGLLNLIFISRKKIMGAFLGWGSLIQCIQFSIGHAFYFDQNQHLQFYMEGLLVTFVLGAFMTYIKERGESIIPAIIFHNVYNGAIPLLAYFIA